jgi:hypothetical protein
MRKHFGIDRKEIRIDDIFDHEYIIACLDLYNIKNNVYYQKHHAGHYMLVKIVNKLEVEIYEPHMDIKEVLSFNGFIGNLFDNETFYTFVNTETSDHVFDFIHKPYILNSDYIDKYKHVTEDMKRLMEWAYEHMEDPYTFQKIFGMLRSTFLARENYFKATAANEEQVTNILNGWKKAQVNYRKMMANRKYLYETIQTIERVFEEEMVYLGSI